MEKLIDASLEEWKTKERVQKIFPLLIFLFVLKNGKGSTMKVFELPKKTY